MNSLTVIKILIKLFEEIVVKNVSLIDILHIIKKISQFLIKILT